MQLAARALNYHFRSRLPKVQQWIHRPIPCQQHLWTYLCYAARNTNFGKTYHFNSLKKPEQFAQMVPLQDYESLKTFIQPIFDGQQNVLWHSDIRYFAKSSGTTADKSKYIPISTRQLYENHFKASSDILTLYITANPQSQLFEGKGVVVGGSSRLNPLNQKAMYGDLSAILSHNMPSIGRYLRTPSVDIALLPNWEEKLERTANLVIRQKITQMAGVPTWLLVLLRRIITNTKAENMSEVWRDFELYLHGGVSFAPYRQQFEQLFPSEKVQYWQTYNASEGFFGIQDQPQREDMLLLVNHDIYYEFLPMSEINAPNPRTLQLHEVEMGVNYALVISNTSGLWRYMLGDTIQFTTLCPYRIKVTGRTKHYINAFGEEVMVDNTDQALAQVAKKHQVAVRDYTVAPCYFDDTQNGAHEWLIAFEQEPKDMEQFATDLDYALQQINSDYEAKRFKDIAMRMPTVRAVPSNIFEQWLRQKNKLGGQNKVPRLSNDRQFLEQILTIWKEADKL